MLLERGLVIGGRYRLEKSVGAGGMGVVWAALDLRTNEIVAVKALLDSARQDPEIVRRFVREARAAIAVEHPNVVRIREALTWGDEPFIVMDYLEGESLAQRLRARGRLPLGAFAELFVPIVSAVETAHGLGIVHRDLKPDNVFLVKRPDGREEPRLLDFGIAKLTAITGAAGVSGGALTSTGAVLGTPYYMSPEQVFGDKQIDHRADIWSLGTIAFECLSGRRMIQGETIGQLLKVITTGAIPRLGTVTPGLPRDVGEIVDRMLSFERADRASLREVLGVLRPFAALTLPSFAGATVRMDPGTSLPTDGARTERTSSPFDASQEPPVPSSVSPVAATLFEAPNARGGLVGRAHPDPQHGSPSFTARSSEPGPLPSSGAFTPPSGPGAPGSVPRPAGTPTPSLGRILTFAIGGLLVGLLLVWMALRVLRPHSPGAPPGLRPGAPSAVP